MTNIKQLLRKYEKPVPGERYTPEYKRKLHNETQKKHRHLLLDELLNETPFTLKPYQKQQIQYWIDRFNNDFKKFHRQASNETIILALIFIQYKQANKGIKLEKYKITEKYNLTLPIFETIQNELIFQLMKTTELRYSQSKYYDHEKEKNKDNE